ncbi:MAG: minor capsid protein [Ruminococcus sp.]|nr:minor capsid protein [Ruminococcus sp.]
MFTPEELESIPIVIEKLFSDLQLRVMTDIVRRLTNVQDISASADYQMSRLYELGKSKKEIQRLVQETLDKSNEEIDSIFTDIIQGGYARDEQLYTAVGKDFIPYEENKPLQQLVNAMRSQTKDDCHNLTQSMGFAVKQPDGKLAFKPIAKYYQDTLDKAVVDITSGTFDYNTVLNRTVTEMTNSGLRTVDYASGWSNRVNVAARRAVMTGVRQVTAKISEDNAEKLETEYFEVSWHRGARPSHQEFQGKVYSKDELVSICGLGTVTGLGGANCYHSYDSFIPGVSERKYTDEWLAEQNDKENTPVEYNGKEYTVYEATQRQRSLETTMRAQREKIKLLEEGNADEDSIITAKARYFKTSDEYVRFSKAMDLPQQRERVYIDCNGRMFDKSVAKSAESGIIKNIELPVETDDIRSMSLETKNEISNAFDNILKDYEIRIDELVSKPLNEEYKNVPFQFQPDKNEYGEFIKRIVINTNYDFMGSQEAFQNRIMKNYNNKVLNSNSIEGLIAHELAHVMTFQSVHTYTGYLLENKKVTKRFIYGVSKYADASLDGAECIAEAFSAIRCGNKISEDEQTLINEFIERWRK